METVSVTVTGYDAGLHLKRSPIILADPLCRVLTRLSAEASRGELRDGLAQDSARIAPKFFYDRLGSALFAAICETDEYYPTRTEAAIFAANRGAIVQAIGPDACLIDLGAGNCAKAAGLFGVLNPARYVAVDISEDYLRESLVALARSFPGLSMTGLVTDFSVALDLQGQVENARRWFFYPGSSIGNFDPVQARHFLRSLREQTDDEGGLLIGFDLCKPVPMLESAYDDALGVTAAFNMNVLCHVNRLLGSDFNPRQWRHRAFFDAVKSRIEMHLEAREAVWVRWPEGERRFVAGERIHTENSYKFTQPMIEALLSDAGFRLRAQWQDASGWFAVVLADPV